MAKARKWHEVKREITYKKYSQTVERRDYKMPDGEVRDYYLRVELPGVCALALTTDNKIITLPQYRPGPDDILRELPGGRVDEAETHLKRGYANYWRRLATLASLKTGLASGKQMLIQNESECNYREEL